MELFGKNKCKRNEVVEFVVGCCTVFLQIAQHSSLNCFFEIWSQGVHCKTIEPKRFTWFLDIFCKLIDCHMLRKNIAVECRMWNHGKTLYLSLFCLCVTHACSRRIPKVRVRFQTFSSVFGTRCWYTIGF